MLRSLCHSSGNDSDARCKDLVPFSIAIHDKLTHLGNHLDRNARSQISLLFQDQQHMSSKNGAEVGALVEGLVDVGDADNIFKGLNNCTEEIVGRALGLRLSG